MNASQHTLSYTPEQVQNALRLLREGACTHLDALKTALPASLCAETYNPVTAAAGHRFSVCAFNMETGARLEEILLYFKLHPALMGMDAILVNEADSGMLRSGNKNVTRLLADALCMNYVYGVEFITASAFQGGNGPGMHGNAILSRFPLLDADVVRLPIVYEWFHKPGDPRLGMRNAVLARIATPTGPVTLCSAHLENRATPAGREKQLAFLLAEMDRRFGSDAPVLLGGDMNTNTVDGDDDSVWPPLARDEAAQLYRASHIAEFEPLLDTAASFGYDAARCNLSGKITRRKPVAGLPDLRLNLDWFFSRGISCEAPGCVATVFDHRALQGGEAYAALDGREFSDHDILTVNCRV